MSDAVPRLHPNQVHVDAAIVRRLIATQFPEGIDLPIQRVPSAGTVNAIYRLGDFVVRLPLLPEFVEALQKELEWLPRLASALPLATPEVVAVGEPDDAYPLSWAVYRWIEGTPWATDAIGDETAAAETLADFIHALQSVSPTGGPPARPGYQGSAVRYRDEVVRLAIDQAAGLVDAAAITDAWSDVLTVPDWGAAPLWVHGDLLAPNLLLRRGRPHAVLDYGNVCVGDPAVDIAAGWALFGPEARRRFRDALRPDDATWERARGWALTGIQGVVYYAATNPTFAEDCRLRMLAALDDR